jgi:hypothetical protein
MTKKKKLKNKSLKKTSEIEVEKDQYYNALQLALCL